ncbi:MAG TPA: hypothetical protein VE378_06565 [Nitrososphaeraceae archaeon]|nr:hypothetical protein [Nitrososphaeraceae archaeon]
MREIFSDTIKHNSSSTKRMIIFGAVGGIIAGLIMAPFMMLTALLVGMPAETMPIAIGLAFGADINSAMMTGFGLHSLTSILIGVIFGTVVANVSKLRISTFTKGVSEGLIAGMIAFVVLFIPVSMSMMPPVLMGLVMQMNPTMNQQQIMGMLQQNMPTMIGMGVLEHLVYGAVLGTITAALIRKVNPGRR